MRLSINGAGKVRVGMPIWTPYAAGVVFAKNKSEWINKQLANHSNDLLKEGDLIGKAHRLHFVLRPELKTITSRINPSEIVISSSQSPESAAVQQKALGACEKALKAEAEHLLPQRLALLAKRHSYTYKESGVRKLISRWGSCSNTKVIILSYYLIQLPWELIDYVLLHELTHTKHLNHGKGFWEDFQKSLPNAKKLQKEIRLYKPKVKPSTNFLQF
jgi:predicted metal-dependent hydrolase